MTAQVQSPAGRISPQTGGGPWPSSLPEDHLIRLAPAETGPAVLSQYAAMIACFWRDCQRRGLLDPAESLDVIDLCPGEVGLSAWLMSAVERRLGDTRHAGLRYLPAYAEAPAGQGVAHSDDDCPENPGRRHVRWRDSLEGTALYMADGHGSSQTLYRPGNPAVVIAHDAWSQLHQDLFAMHYGRLLRADLELLMHPQKEREEMLWQPVGDSAWEPALAPLLERYRTEFNSAPVVYPAAAFRFMAAAQAAAVTGLLVISLAPGCTSDLSLRLSSFNEITDGYRRSGRFPVNFQLLARWAGHAGGVTAEVDLPGCRVLQAMLLGPVSSVPRLEAVRGCVDPAWMSSGFQLAEVVRTMGPGVGLEARLTLLQLSRFDPGVFLVGAQGIIKELARVQGSDRRPWRQAIEQVWAHQHCFPAGKALPPLLAQAAMHCGHWGLARRILADCLAKTGDDAGHLANLAWCEARTGNLPAGISLVEQAIALDPGNVLANEIRRRLASRASARDQQWLVELRHSELPLVLEPLDDSHAEALSYQYRDPQIAIMTGLPAMSTPADVRKWMADQQAEAGRVNYAVMHADWGFVGFINLAVSGSAAFFCFWTGVDYQGMGFATAAGRLACSYAAQVGVPVMLTSAYKDNHRSIRALKRLGFLELPIRACPPEQDRIFFALIDARAGEIDPNIELRDYYCREHLPMTFDPSSYGLPPATETNGGEA